MRLQTRKPQKLKETLIGNHKETQKTLKTSGLFHFTRLVPNNYIANGNFPRKKEITGGKSTGG